MARILIYALGSGLGHLSRQLGFARVAARAKHEVEILCRGELVHRISPKISIPDVRLNLIPLDWSADEVRASIHQRLTTTPFDLLVVDTFPRGILGELEPWLQRRERSPAVFVHRLLRTEFACIPGVREAVRLYDLVFLPGESGVFASTRDCIITDPWLQLSHEDLLSRSRARSIWHASELPLMLVVGTGTPQEVQELARVAELLQTALKTRADIRLVTPGDGHSWPLLHSLAGVDILVGSGGYNLVHEARLTKTPLFAFSRTRLYDNQGERLRSEERVDSSEMLVCQLHELLNARDFDTERQQEVPFFTSGVQQAWHSVQLHLLEIG